MAKKTDEYTHGRAARRRKKNRKKYTVYYILAAVMMLAIGAALSLTVFFNITVITVEGDTRYDSDDIIDASDVYIGDNLFRVIGGDVKENIVSEFPYIEDVKIQRVLPEELVIKISECKPAVTVEREEEYILLSDEGRMLEKESDLPDDYPRIVGLNTEEMISYMRQAKVFVMPSAIENESSTLREAMFLGMPVVSSFAGDIYETVVHGENGFVYRFEEPEMLAYFTRMLLNSPKLSIQLGAKAGESIRNLYADYNYGKSLLEVYHARKR